MEDNSQWTEIAPVEDLGDLSPGESITIDIETDEGTEKSVVIVKGSTSWYAVENQCSHDDGPLDDGLIDIEHCSIQCGRHGAEFNLNSGEVLSMPAVAPIGSYQVKEEKGILYIKL